MKVVRCRRPAPDLTPIFEDVELADPPAPCGRELLVRVMACAINPLDLKRRAARPVNDPLGAVLGWDAAGVVVATGPETQHYRPGDPVFYAGAGNRPGCQSELHLVDERITAPIPAKLSFAAAASLPMAAITSSELLFDHLKLDRSHHGALLIVGGAGSIASMTIQLARCLTRARVIATASRAASAAWVRSLGAHEVINHLMPLIPQLAELGIASVDWIVCTRTTPLAWSQFAQLIAPFGHICLIDHPLALDFTLMKSKSVAIHWQSMFTRTVNDSAGMARHGTHLTRCASLVAAGNLKVTTGKCFTQIDACSVTAAHRLHQQGGTLGKIVLGGLTAAHWSASRANGRSAVLSTLPYSFLGSVAKNR